MEWNIEGKWRLRGNEVRYKSEVGKRAMEREGIVIIVKDVCEWR